MPGSFLSQRLRTTPWCNQFSSARIADLNQPFYYYFSPTLRDLPTSKLKLCKKFDEKLPIGGNREKIVPMKVKFAALCLSAAALIVCSILPVQAAGLDLSAYRGKVVYLDFWASWCTPCHLSFPWMNDIQQSYGAEGLAVVAVNLDRDRAAADAFLAANKGQLQIVYDPQGAIAKQFNFKDMPTAILIGRDGKIHATHSGFLISQENSYLADVVSLLRQKAP